MIEFHGKDARIAVCSNKTEDLVLEILDALDAARWIHAAVGHLPERKQKPDPEPLFLAIGEAGGDVSRAIMVGDSAADVGAARGAGIPVVLVPGGYGGRDIRTLGADRIVSNGRTAGRNRGADRRPRCMMLSSMRANGPIPAFALERAASGCKCRNRDTRMVWQAGDSGRALASRRSANRPPSEA